jgi:Flp pilus assembly protein TadB
LAAVLCAAVTGFLLPRGTAPAVGRLAGLLGSGTPTMSEVPSDQDSAAGHNRDATAEEERRAVLTRRGVAALVGIAAAVLLGRPVGLLAGVGVAVACARMFATLEPRAVRERRARLVADLPIAIDLMAACLRGGSSWGESVEAVATALGGPLGAELHWVAAQISLGADPVTTWLTLADEPALAALARAAARTSDSGSALAPTLARLAQDQRRAARAEASARAQAAGVRAVAPLGLCFLPAFVLIGIVPAIAGIATRFLLP